MSDTIGYWGYICDAVKWIPCICNCDKEITNFGEADAYYGAPIDVSMNPLNVANQANNLRVVIDEGSISAEEDYPPFRYDFILTSLLQVLDMFTGLDV